MLWINSGKCKMESTFCWDRLASIRCLNFFSSHLTHWKSFRTSSELPSTESRTSDRFDVTTPESRAAVSPLSRFGIYLKRTKRVAPKRNENQGLALSDLHNGPRTKEGIGTVRYRSAQNIGRKSHRMEKEKNLKLLNHSVVYYSTS